MKTVRYVDENTLEIKKVYLGDSKTKNKKIELDPTDELNLLEEALGCDSEDFIEAYNSFVNAEEKFKKLYEPFKEKLINLYEKYPKFSKTVIVGDAKLTYVSPSTRNIIDAKKLKEEEPALAKKYTKTTDVKATIRLEKNGK